MKIVSLDHALDAARRHGEEGEFEDGASHEVGDLQDMLKMAWRHLSPPDQAALLLEYQAYFDEGS